MVWWRPNWDQITPDFLNFPIRTVRTPVVCVGDALTPDTFTTPVNPYVVPELFPVFSDSAHCAHGQRDKAYSPGNDSSRFRNWGGYGRWICMGNNW